MAVDFLTHYQMTNFRLFQTEGVCRRQFQIWQKWQKVILMGRKRCGKRRNCSLWAISPLPTVFSKGLFPRASKGVIVWEWVNPFPHNDTFGRPLEASLLKILWEKEKLLIMSNFSFTPSVFYLFRELSAIFIKFTIVVCKLFQFGRV